MPKQKGFSQVVIIVIVAGILILVGGYIYKSQQKPSFGDPKHQIENDPAKRVSDSEPYRAYKGKHLSFSYPSTWDVYDAGDYIILSNYDNTQWYIMRDQLLQIYIGGSYPYQYQAIESTPVNKTVNLYETDYGSVLCERKDDLEIDGFTTLQCNQTITTQELDEQREEMRYAVKTVTKVNDSYFGLIFTAQDLKYLETNREIFDKFLESVKLVRQ